MADTELTARVLRELQALGVHLSIDDFGTGYSSLAYLRQFPIDSLKIDRSFIRKVGRTGESNALVHTFIQLGKALGIETLAEGIEEEAQLDQLQREAVRQRSGLLVRPSAGRGEDRGLLCWRFPLRCRPATSCPGGEEPAGRGTVAGSGR